MNCLGQSGRTDRDEFLVAYLDHQVWCGMAENSPKYQVLSKALDKVVSIERIILPYSTVHIQELAEIGKLSGLSRTERLKKAIPKLEFIKKVSKSVILETNEDYSKFALKTRDPVEAFETFTEVELGAATTKNFTDFIPKTLVHDIQKHFNVGAERLNNMTEEDAVIKINFGFKAFAEKCQSDKEFHRAFVDEAKKHSAELVLKAHSQSTLALDQARQIALLGLKEGNLTEAENESVQKVLSTMELQRVQLDDQLLSQIQAAQDACEKSYSAETLTYTFEMLLDQVTQFEQGQSLRRSLNKTLLLNFFGYKAKLSNRRSDFYDALHREYAKVCNCFVTDDSRLQEKLGGLNKLIEGTKCQILSPEDFERAIEHIVGDAEGGV